VSGPRVSVVVSSYQRPIELARLLRALAAQTLPTDEFEVIAVDNGSGAETGQVLELAGRELDLDLHPVRLESTLGPAGGRNRGWRTAAAPLIAFTDDDCIPTPAWLERLLAAAGESGVPRPAPQAGPVTHTIIQGATEPVPKQLEAARHILFARIVSVHAADGRYETCNILYPRDLLEQLDGFDERFRPRGIGARPVGEDTDLGWRARAAGAVTRFAPDALVHHDVVQFSPLGKLAHQTRWGGAVHIFKVHPAAREILFRRVFWNVWHYMLLQALGSLAGPRWLRRLILGRYLRALTDRAQEGGAGVWAVPYLVLEDATEAAVLLAASARERTLLI
jgi:glycosyltransferase involved in cell wall biosynthesis